MAPLGPMALTSTELVPAAEPPAPTQDIPETIATKHYEAELDRTTGALVSLRSKSSGRELLVRPQELVSAQLKDGRLYTARKASFRDGTLTIAGRTEPVRTEVTVTPAPGNALRVQGEQSLRMSAFGVKPPSLLLGALKVRDLVRVAFDIVVRRPVAGLLGSRPPALAGPRIR